MRTEVLCAPGLSVSCVKLRGEADPGRAQASAKRGMRGPRGREPPAGWGLSAGSQAAASLPFSPLASPRPQMSDFH